MPVTINSSGYIEVFRDGVFVSRHNVESNAIESVIAHAELNGDGDYELRYPNKVVMSRLRKQVVPFSWNPITLAFVNGTASSVSLAGFLANPENRSVTYSVTGTLPTGVTLTGSTVAYNGTGAVASASVRFNASWNGLTAVSSASTVSINAAAPANRTPVFSVAPTTATIPYTGGTVQFTASDPDADALTYTLPVTRTGITINSASGLVTVASSAAGTSGSITVRATDPRGAFASASCAVTVQSAQTGGVIFNPNVEAATTPQEIFTEDVNNYDGGTAAIVTDPNPRPGTTKSLRLRYTFTADEPGVELKFPAFTPTPTLFTRSYERFATGWATNWPVGNKTARYFTNPNFTTDDGSGGWAYCSEKLIWQTYSGDPNDQFARGYNCAIYNLDLEGVYGAGVNFANGLPYIREETWYKFERWFVLNSALDAADGIMRIWIDDRLVCDRSNVVWRSSSRGCTNGAAGWSSMWFGGNYSGAVFGRSSVTLDRYMNGFYVSRTLDR